jgi:hypothetical protein
MKSFEKKDLYIKSRKTSLKKNLKKRKKFRNNIKKDKNASTI